MGLQFFVGSDLKFVSSFINTTNWSLSGWHVPCSCQTYEGGIAGEPGSEAHGGYVLHTFHRSIKENYVVNPHYFSD